MCCMKIQIDATQTFKKLEETIQTKIDAILGLERFHNLQTY